MRALADYTIGLVIVVVHLTMMAVRGDDRVLVNPRPRLRVV